MSVPPTHPQAEERARLKMFLTIICAAIVFSAILILVLPIPLALPLKLVVVATDLITAAAIWLIGRQKFSKK